MRPEADVCFTWNGTTSGARVPDGDWIAADREGLTFCDATSAAFAQDLPWAKLDVTTFSWQKAMGGEGGHGVLILSPRAVERLESFTPPRPLPKIFRLTKGGKLIEGIFAGETINTPSMLAVADAIDALDWMEGIGGLAATRARADANVAALQAWVDRDAVGREPGRRPGDALEHLGLPDGSSTRRSRRSTRRRSATSSSAMTKLLESEGVAYDIAGYRDAPPGLRVWCGTTVDTADVAALGALARLGLRDAPAAERRSLGNGIRRIQRPWHPPAAASIVRPLPGRAAGPSGAGRRGVGQFGQRRRGPPSPGRPVACAMTW